MLRKIMIVFATAAALAAGLTANAFAFSGGVSHVVTHPVSMARAENKSLGHQLGDRWSAGAPLQEDRGGRADCPAGLPQQRCCTCA
jgi:hypothetical protein